MQHNMTTVSSPFSRKFRQIRSVQNTKDKIATLAGYFWDRKSATIMLTQVVHNDELYYVPLNEYIAFDDFIADILTEYYASGGKIPYEWLTNRVLYPLELHRSGLVTYPSLDDYDAMEHPKGYGGDDA